WWVIADVSNHTFYPNKDHHYFDLVEKEEGGHAIVARAQAVAWRTGTARIREFEGVSGQRFTAGIRVCIKVQVDYHAVYGLKLIVLDVDPSYTIGQLELQRLATIHRLLTECSSYVQKVGDRFRTRNNGLEHPAVIQRLAVLSSSSAAGYQDFMHALLNNRFGYQFTVNNYFTAVQGEANAEAAARRIREICASGIPFDAVVIIRGGGADTDFLLFDHFAFCKEVARLRIPVITGIGHLKNQTLVDLVAHTSTAAPTKAAEYIIAHNQAFEAAIQGEQQRLVIRAQQVLQRASQSVLAQQAEVARATRALLTDRKEEGSRLREKTVHLAQKLLNGGRGQLAELANRIILKPQLCLANEQKDLESMAHGLKLHAARLLDRQKSDIAYREVVCRMMSPVNLLKKGFALVYHEGRIIAGGDTVQPGVAITVRLGTSELEAVVTHKKQTDEDSFNI
ncbi:MAG TPA: exodeoxyribonuclease VII large subunit, partial [Chitinophagaceae bacterium]